MLEPGFAIQIFLAFFQRLNDPELKYCTGIQMIVLHAVVN